MKLVDHLQDAHPDVRKIILTIASDSKKIKGFFFSKIADSDSTNIYGESQIELEKEADELLIRSLRESGVVKVIASEERDAVIETGQDHGLGVTLDPLDGSSCIKTNISVGTIVGIFEGNVLGDVKPIASLYVLYGPLTTLTYTTGAGVHEFVLSESGEYTLRREHIKIPEGKIFAPGGLKKDFTSEHKRLLEDMENQGFKLRYTGSFVADINQILEYGGFYSYPKLQNRPEGKLRLLFEAYPMAFLLEQAGGYASNGQQSILDIKPEKPNQRVPLYIGSGSVVRSIKV